VGILAGKSRENFNAFDDAVLGLHDFQCMCTNFETGAGFRDIFKMFKD
jgi:hypothetical protein